MTVDPSAYMPVYRQLARILREDIASGRYGSGELLPSEARLAQIYEVGRDTVRGALALLRSTGHVVTVKGVGTRVREDREVTMEPIGKGARVSARMPTEDERRELALPEGVPLLVVERDGEDALILPADQKVLVVE